jgi:class 3 adenylate cyclase
MAGETTTTPGTTTPNKDELSREKRTVVFFDICSSSNMLEDLILSENLRSMRDLILTIRGFIKKEAKLQGFEVYKFIGDGWVLLFPPEWTGESLVTLLEELCRRYKKHWTRYVKPRLQTRPSVVGLTFGVDRGELLKFRMMGQPEYIGRALNVASRLQGAVKQKDDNPAYKVLFSNPSFKALRLSPNFRPSKTVTCALRNIQGGAKYSCVKMTLKV